MPGFVVMGVAGCGKSTAGALLAARLGVPFADGDSLPSGGADRIVEAILAHAGPRRWPSRSG